MKEYASRQLTAWPSKFGAEDRELVTEFFVAFSRFECALKRARYFTTRKKDPPRDAEADWTRFATDHKTALSQALSPSASGAVEYILAHPPEKQVVTEGGGSLEWVADGAAPTDISPHRILDLVRRVRNNLFHGGKWPSDPGIDEVGRNAALLRAALDVLAACLNCSPSVQVFFGNAEA